MSLLRSLVKLGRPYTCTVIQRCARQDLARHEVCRLHTSSICRVSDVKDTIASIYDDSQPKNEEMEKPAKPAFVPAKSFVFGSPEQRIGGEYFPTQDVYHTLFDGVKYEDLPITWVISTKQNTKACSFQGKSKGISMQTGGTVGFKNCKKKTSVCGQTVGFALGLDLVKKGYVNTRVVLKGFGAGRLAALKGLQLAGVNIVSIKDSTFPDVANRARGSRSL